MFRKFDIYKTGNHPESSQTSYKPAEPVTNHPNDPQISHKPVKPPTNRP